MTKYIFGFLLIGFSVIGCNSRNELQSQLLNNEGIDFMEQQNFSSALVKFQEALKLKQSDEMRSQIYRNIATVFFNMEEMDSSIVYSKKASEYSKPGTYLYYLNKAEYDLLTDHVPEAIALLKKAGEVDPGKMETYNNLSLIYNGNYGDQFIDLPKALENAQKAFDLNSSPGNEEQLAGVYFQMENFKKSTEHYSALMKQFPEVKLYQLYAGNSMFFEGRTTEGMALMEDAAARDETCRQLLDELMADNED